MKTFRRLPLLWGLGVAAGFGMWAIDRWATPSLGTWLLTGVVAATVLPILLSMFRDKADYEALEAPSAGSWVYGEIGVIALGGGALLTIAATTGEAVAVDTTRIVPSDLRVTLPGLVLEILAFASVVVGILMLLMAVIPSFGRGFEGYAGPLHVIVRPLVAVLAWAALFIGYAVAFAGVEDTGTRATVLVWAGLVGVMVAGVHVLYAAVLSEVRR